MELMKLYQHLIAFIAVEFMERKTTKKLMMTGCSV
jgi:hypothetical protein